MWGSANYAWEGVRGQKSLKTAGLLSSLAAPVSNRLLHYETALQRETVARTGLEDWAGVADVPAELNAMQYTGRRTADDNNIRNATCEL